jgi:hypothetical protein
MSNQTNKTDQFDQTNQTDQSDQSDQTEHHSCDKPTQSQLQQKETTTRRKHDYLSSGRSKPVRADVTLRC